jgi:two-component system sensor histidine kinase RegB
MTDTAATPNTAPSRMVDGDYGVGLRTLVMIRWVAVVGQTVTLLTVHYGLRFEVPIVPTLIAVGASVLFNLALVFRRPMKSRISHVEAAIQLGYDIVQLGVLLFLTGGLKNPFALLILAPVTVSATVLPRSNTIGLGLVAGTVITVLSVVHLPFPSIGAELVLPDFYILGLWEAMILGTVFIAGYVGSISEEARRLSTGFVAAQLALAREQQLSAVGALAAAAAHELGSPLATIAVTAREMLRDTPSDSDLHADAELLVEQSERCRAILAHLGRPLEPDALSPMSQMPIGALVESAAMPYRSDDVALSFRVRGGGRDDRAEEPMVPRRAEIIQGLGTLIQNAVDFAASRVEVETTWDSNEIRVEIADDGPGFPRGVLERFGEPYVSNRAGEGGHMGLGIFIAVTLLERTGGIVLGRNRPGGGGVVEVHWPRRHFAGIMPAGKTTDGEA